MPSSALLLGSLLLACTGDDPDGGDGVVAGIAALGGGSGDLGAVRVTTISTDDDGLDLPRALAFDPEVADRLWVVNRGDDGATIISGAGTDAQEALHIVDPYAMHFMEEVSSIAFGQPGTFGTCQESRNTYNGQYAPNDFMGPTLWSSDLDVYGSSNPDAVDYLTDLYGFPVDLGSHLDMQHESPLCVGIAWERDNRYWVFDGQEGSIDMVDFHEDHGVGFDDHSDGETATYVSGELSRVEDVPGHLALDLETSLLYIADTGNGRIAVLDTASGTRGEDRRLTEPGTQHYEVDGAELWTLVDGLDQPSGLFLHQGVLYLTEHGAGMIRAYDLEGQELDALDPGLEPGALMGITARGPDDLWLVDAVQDQVLRLQPAE